MADLDGKFNSCEFLAGQQGLADGWYHEPWLGVFSPGKGIPRELRGVCNTTQGVIHELGGQIGDAKMYSIESELE
jgi:hypothetical protein